MYHHRVVKDSVSFLQTQSNQITYVFIYLFIYKRRVATASIYLKTPSNNIIYLFVNVDQPKTSCVYLQMHTYNISYLITHKEQVKQLVIYNSSEAKTVIY